MISHVLMAALIGFNVANPAPLPDPITFAVVGDSLSAGCTGEMYAGDEPTSCSWPYTLQNFTHGQFRYVGGYAHGGLRSDQLLYFTQPVEADVLIVLAGTNDLNQNMAPETVPSKVEAIALSVGAPTVIVLAAPPFDRLAGTGWVEGLNAGLEQMAYRHDWGYIDPWIHYRAPGGTWEQGASNPDGIHPTRLTALMAGRIIADYTEMVTR